MSLSSENSDLRWVRTPWRSLLQLAWPIAVSTVSYSVMTLVDTFFVGRLGPDALAGVGLAGTISFALIVFGFGFSRTVKTLVSQAVGARRMQDVPAIRATGVVYALALGALTWLAGAVVLWWLGTHHEGQYVMASAHLRIRLLSLPAVLLSSFLREARQGEGDARSPMWATLCANVSNIALNVLFVGVLDWGVQGSALATVFAHHLELAWMLIAGRAHGPLLVKLTRRDLTQMWTLGAPTGVQFLMEIGAFSILTLVITSLGSTQMAAHQIAIQVIHFSFLPMLAVAEAASVLAGNAVGAGRNELVSGVVYRAWALVLAYGGICGLMFLLQGELISSAFTKDVDVVHVATRLLVVAAAFQMFDGVNIVMRCVLRAVSDVRFPAVVGIVCAWCLTPPLAWYLGIVRGLGAWGGWIGFSGEIMLCSMLLFARFVSGRWKIEAERARARLREASARELSTSAIA